MGSLCSPLLLALKLTFAPISNKALHLCLTRVVTQRPAPSDSLLEEKETPPPHPPFPKPKPPPQEILPLLLPPKGTPPQKASSPPISKKSGVEFFLFLGLDALGVPRVPLPLMTPGRRCFSPLAEESPRLRAHGTALVSLI